MFVKYVQDSIHYVNKIYQLLQKIQNIVMIIREYMNIYYINAV